MLRKCCVVWSKVFVPLSPVVRSLVLINVLQHMRIYGSSGRDTNLLCGKYYADNDITNAIGGFTIYVPSCPPFVLILHLVMGIQNMKFVVCLKLDR